MSFKKILFITLCLAPLTSRSIFSALPARSTNFSGCSFENHRDVSGDLIAYNATLKSLTIEGSADLENATVFQELRVTDELHCKNCTIGSLFSQANIMLIGTTATGKITSSGKFHCRNSILQELATSANTTIDTTTIIGNTENTEGSTTATHSKFADITLHGDFKGRNISCKNLFVKGTTNLFKSTVLEAATLSGETKCTECFFNVLTTTEKTKLIETSAQEAVAKARLIAENCLFGSLTIAGHTATLTDCTIGTIYVQTTPNQKAPTITINTSQNTSAVATIKKIICLDPAIRIIYGKNTIPAHEVLGTNHIQKN